MTRELARFTCVDDDGATYTVLKLETPGASFHGVSGTRSSAPRILFRLPNGERVRPLDAEDQSFQIENSGKVVRRVADG